MLRKLRPRSVYDVFAVLALFVAVSTGGAYAANTVFSTDIADNQVYPADVRDDNLSGGGLTASDLANGSITTGEVRDDTQFPYGLYSQDLAEGSVKSSEIADSAVGSSEVQNNSLTGTDINESSLGKVPDADKLDGLDSDNFIQGKGDMIPLRALVASGHTTPLLGIGEFATLSVECNTDATTNGSFSFVEADAGSLNLFVDEGGDRPNHHSLSSPQSVSSFMVPGGDALTYSLASGSRTATVFLFSDAFHNPVLNQDFCEFQGLAIVN